MDIADVVKLAPAIFSFLGGPTGGLAGAAIEWLAGQVGASDKTQDSIKAALINADPIRMKELDLDFQKFCLQNGIQLQLAQIGVNTEEAKSTNWFVAGGRPYIVWVCGTGLAYQVILAPILNGILGISRFPSIDLGTLSQLLIGILGLGALRTYEKYTGTSENH